VNPTSGTHRDVLSSFRDGFRRAAHILKEKPDHVFPQIHNRLMTEAHGRPALTKILESAGTVYRRPWLRVARALQKTSASCLMTLTGHDSPIERCAVFPDGRRGISVDEAGLLILWDLEEGREKAVHRTSPILAPLNIRRTRRGIAGGRHFILGYSGDRIAMETKDGLLLMSLEDGRILASLKGYKGRTANPSQDGVVIEHPNQELCLWVLESNSEIPLLPSQPGGSLACRFTRDGRIVSAGADGTLRTWDAFDGALIETISLSRCPVPLMAAVIDSQGLRVATQSLIGSDRASKFEYTGATKRVVTILWDAANGQRLADFVSETTFPLFVFGDSDASFVLGMSDKDYILARSSDGRAFQRMTSDNGPFSEALITHGGNRLMALTRERGASLLLYDLDHQREFPLLQSDFGPIQQWLISPDGKLAASLSVSKYGNAIKPEDTLKIWDLETGRERIALRGHTHSISDFAFSPDSRYLLSASWDKTLKVWDIGPAIDSSDGTLDEFSRISCAFSADGRRIALMVSRPGLSARKDVRIWDSASAAETARGHDVNLSPDGGILAFRSPTEQDAHIFHDLSSGRDDALIEDLPNRLISFVFSPDGRRAAIVNDKGGLILWEMDRSGDARRFPDLGVYLKAHGSPREKSPIRFCPLGSSLLFLSGATALTRLSYNQGTAIEFFADHSAPITDFGFSPDGRIAFSVGEDHILRYWAAENGSRLGSIKGPKGARYLFNKDGRRIAAETDSEVELWDIESGRRLLHRKDIGRFIGGGDPCSFTPDGRRLIVTNNFVWDSDSQRFETKIFDAVDGREMASLGGAEIDMSPARQASGRLFYRGVTGIAMSPDSRFLILSNDCLTLWEMEGKRSVAGLYGLLGMVPAGAIDFSPDGRTFVVADKLGQVLLFSIENVK